MILEIFGCSVLVIALPLCVAICVRIGWYVGGIFTTILDLWLQKRYSIEEKTE